MRLLVYHLTVVHLCVILIYKTFVCWSHGVKTVNTIILSIEIDYSVMVS